ncbi:MAG: hypothetical protein KA150_08825, partial [Propionivibrio sp.]|nr:hypothetical protein [Propionivibrio sp.]
MNDISPETERAARRSSKHPRTQGRQPVASDVLAADSRRLASMKRDLRHLYGTKHDALQVEYDKL